jgi:hypothetical protein
MSKTADSILVAAGVFLAATGFASAQAPGATTTHVRCNIGVPSGVTEPMTMMAQVYRVGRDNLGKYQLRGQTQSLIVVVTPGEGGSGSGVFDTDLEVGADSEYEFKVVPLDKMEGTSGRTERHCFVSADSPAISRQDRLAASVVSSDRELEMDPQDQLYKSNFLQVVQDPGAQVPADLYVNDPTDIPSGRPAAHATRATALKRKRRSFRGPSSSRIERRLMGGRCGQDLSLRFFAYASRLGPDRAASVFPRNRLRCVIDRRV